MRSSTAISLGPAGLAITSVEVLPFSLAVITATYILRIDHPHPASAT